MKIEQTYKWMLDKEKECINKRYFGDATDWSFQRHTLLFLESIDKQLKENAKQMKYLWQTIDELKDASSTDKGEKT